MSFIDSALNIASTVARFVPGYGTAASLAIDLAHKVWNMAEPMVQNIASAAVDQFGGNLSPEQRSWAQDAVRQII
jgi:hypothetical protein